MASEDTKVLPKSYPMNGGDGPLSYAHNSSLQKGVVDVTKEMIKEAIADKLDIGCFESSNTFQIADLGCSVGPNTFFSMQNIIEAVEHKYYSKHQKSQTLDFQVFFNDHSNNDFNTLFRSLPPSRRYFAAGVPGSFYGRIFPKSTIHFVHCSSSLNWLSRVPKEVVDSDSPAWNKGSIYCTGTKKEVAEAYSAQYEKDMETFLNARAQELVGGGLMVLLFGALPNGITLSQTINGKNYDHFGSCLSDMAKKGLLSEEKVNSFNLPLYFASVKELRAMIDRNEYFSIEIMDEMTENAKQIGDLTDMRKRVRQNSQMHTMQIRAGLEGLVKDHFGNEIVEEIFESYTKKHVKNSLIFTENDYKNISLIFLVLKCKNN